MNAKGGITLVMLVTALVVMMVIITSASIIGSDAIVSANFEEYTSMIRRLQDNVSSYYLENKSLPITNQVVSGESLGNDFTNALAKNKDENQKLFVVDVSLLNNHTLKSGQGTVMNKDVFLVAEGSHNVYYLKGFNYRGRIVYGNE